LTGPLAGLRVVELATGIAGPYAGRLLTLLGADVVKVEPAGGDMTRTMAVDDEPVRTPPGPLFAHLNAGKRVVTGDPAPHLDGAHVVLDDRVRREREGTALDPSTLASGGAVVVSTTAWGYDAGDAGAPDDELLVQSASGALSALTEAPHGPTRLPGWQAQYLAGGFAAAGALTALARPGGHHVDVSWVGAVVTGVEAGICAFLHAVEQPPAVADDRQRGFQVGAFPAGVFRCADGHVIPGTVRPVDWQLQCGVYGRPDLLEDERFTARLRFANRDALRAEIQPWYDAHTKHEIFRAALDAGWAAAMVMTAGDALDDPHLAARGFLTTTDPLDGGRSATIPAHVARFVPPPQARAADDAVPRPPALDGLKVLELTWAWAGPFVGRHLGAYGADVVRIETGRFVDGWRTRLRWRDAGVEVPEGEDPDGFTWDAAALHNSLNRNKRSLSLDLTHTDGRARFLELLDRADLLILNMSYRMLADRGIEDEVHAAVERGLVVLNMPALGATGPYRDMPGYGILMEGMGGMAARYGDRDEGARSTSTYYPDLVAGLHGTVAALAALGHRSATGEGSLIDLSQQETTWLQFGEAIALRSLEGRVPGRMGNAEPRRAPSGLYPTADDRWVAILVRDDAQYAALRTLVGDALPALSEDERVRRRDELDAAVTAWTRGLPLDDALDRLAAAGVPSTAGASQRRAYVTGALDGRGLIERVVHPLTGDRPYLAMPLRIDGEPWRSRRPAARFAEHTDEVLADWLALDEDERRRLRAAGVIGTRPNDVRRR
jgi:crotonobetainyl-CoA:carnitine CoA-transferase CaiB-like acyl-CoA transferase